MRLDERKWYSPALERELAVAHWGHGGKALVLFPTSGADHLDVARFKLVDALSPLIREGRLQVFSANSVSRETWNERAAPPWYKSRMQARFDAYLAGELLPWVRHASRRGGERVAVAGASLGAYVAINAGAKHPDWIDLSIGMSGWYDMDVFMGGHKDEDYYYNNPLYFLPNLREGAQLSGLRDSLFIVANGGGRWEHLDQAWRLSRVLVDKRIPTRLEVWGPEWDHDWPTWRNMLPHFMRQLV